MRRIAHAVVVLALTLLPIGARAEGPVPTIRPQDGPVTKTPNKTADKTANKTTNKTTKKVKGASNGKTSDKAASSKRPTPKTRTARGKPIGAVAQAGIHSINENAQVTPFPSHAAAAKKALSQNRRDQLQDAEKAARAEHQEDRWQTVLFHLRDFDARSDAEACFWRVLSYYRLGEMGRARTIRQLCTLASKEEAVLDAEDAMCGSLQPAAVMPEMLAAGERPPAPVANPASYAGAAPARLER